MIRWNHTYEVYYTTEYGTKMIGYVDVDNKKQALTKVKKRIHVKEFI